MDTALLAIGTALPRYKLSQAEISELISQGFHLNAAEKRLLKAVYRASGIHYRYSVLDDCAKQPGEFEFFPNTPEASFPSTAVRMHLYRQNALQLALIAIENCLAKLEGFDKKAITHLITISCTGMYAPGIDIELVQHLQLQSTTKRSTINFMGCYGAFNGLKLADSICKAEQSATVLVVCVELCTIHFQRKMNLDNLISNAIFADGAAAALIQASPERHLNYLRLKNFYCDLLPQTSREMAWEIADSGFDIVLSSYVPQAIQSGIAAFVQRLLTHANMKREELDLFAIHPGGIKILQACEQTLNITKDQNKAAYYILQNYGNMSSATILFVIEELWSSLTSADQHKNIFCCAFGPGLTLESMILKPI